MAVVGRDGDPFLEEFVGQINHSEHTSVPLSSATLWPPLKPGVPLPGALCQPTKGGFSFEGALLSIDGKTKLTASRTVTTTDWQKAGLLAAQEL